MPNGFIFKSCCINHRTKFGVKALQYYGYFCNEFLMVRLQKDRDFNAIFLNISGILIAKPFFRNYVRFFHLCGGTCVARCNFMNIFNALTTYLKIIFC